MKTNNVLKALRVAQLLTAGAVIGLYLAKLGGFVGIDVTPGAETFGAAGGAITVGVLKILHFV